MVVYREVTGVERNYNVRAAMILEKEAPLAGSFGRTYKELICVSAVGLVSS
jgi:hypothetical protein